MDEIKATWPSFCPKLFHGLFGPLMIFTTLAMTNPALARVCSQSAIAEKKFGIGNHFPGVLIVA